MSEDNTVGRVTVVFDGDAKGVQDAARQAGEAVKGAAAEASKAGQQMAAGMAQGTRATQQVTSAMTDLIRQAMATAGANATMGEKLNFARQVFIAAGYSAQQFAEAIKPLQAGAVLAAQAIQQAGDKTQQAGQKFNEAQKHVGGFGDKIVKVAAHIFTIEQAFRLGERAFEAFMAPIEHAERFEAFGQSVGSTAQEISKFQYAAREAGLRDEQSFRALTFLTGKMEEARDKTSLVSAQFKALGVDINQGAVPAMMQLLNGLKQIPDERKRVELARELLGARSGGRFLAMHTDAGFYEDAERSGQVVSDSFAKHAREIEHAKEKVEGSFRSFQRNAIEPMLEPLELAADRLSAFFTQNPEGLRVAQQATTLLGHAIEELTSAENLDGLAKAATLAGEIAVSLANAGKSGLEVAGSGFAGIAVAIGNIGKAFNELPDPVKQILIGAAIGARWGKEGAIVGAVAAPILGSETFRNFMNTPAESPEELFNKAVYGGWSGGVGRYSTHAGLGPYSTDVPEGGSSSIPWAKDFTDSPGAPYAPTTGDFKEREQRIKEATATAESARSRAEATRAYDQAVVRHLERELEITKDQGARQEVLDDYQRRIHAAKLDDLHAEAEALKAERAARAIVANIKDPVGSENEQKIKAKGDVERIDQQLKTLGKRAETLGLDPQEWAAKNARELQQAGVIRAGGAVSAAEENVRFLGQKLQMAARDRQAAGLNQPGHEELAIAQQLDEAEKSSLRAKKAKLAADQEQIKNGRELGDLTALESARYDALQTQIAGINHELDLGPKHVRELNDQLEKAQAKLSATGGLLGMMFGNGPVSGRMEGILQKYLQDGINRAAQAAEAGDNISQITTAFGGGGGMAGAAGWVGAAFKLADTVNQVFDWTRERRKAVNAASDIPGVTREQMIEASTKGFPIVGSYLNIGNQLTANLFGSKLGGNINESLLMGGLLGPIGNILPALGVHMFQTPTGEAQLNRSLNRYLSQIGLSDLQTLQGDRGISLREFASVKGGGPISVPGSYAGLDFGAAGGLYSLGLSTSKMPEKSLISGRVQNFLRNSMAGLGLGAEEADRVLKKFEQPMLGKDLDEAGMKLARFYAQGKIGGQDFTDYIGLSLEIFQKLPKAIEASTIALSVFTDNGALNFQRLKEAADDAQTVITNGTKAAFTNLVKNANPQDAARQMADTFANTMVERMAARMTDKLLSGQLSKAMMLAEKAVDAEFSGNRPLAQALLAQARGEFVAGTRTAVGILSPIAMDLRNFGQSLSGGSGGIINSSGLGLPQFGDGGVVPGPLGLPRLVVAHAGEMVLPTHLMGGGAGGAVDRLVSQLTAGGVPVQLTIVDRTEHVTVVDGRELARVSKNNTRLDRTYGLRVPDPMLGVRQ